MYSQSQNHSSHSHTLQNYFQDLNLEFNKIGHILVYLVGIDKCPVV